MPEPIQRCILIVEDEQAIADTLIYALRTEGFVTEHCLLGRDGLAALGRGGFALLILDVGLPDMNGFDLCREIRRESEIPVIFLTARSAEIDRIVGLEIGADDYVVKPFSPREVAARVRTILRRVHVPSVALSDAKSDQAPAPTSDPGFRIDDDAQCIYFQGQVLALTRYEYLLLKTLIEAPRRIFSREQLMQRVWVAPDHSLERTVDTHIKTLRAKLKAVDPASDPIVTHRGIGYGLRGRR
ncbi:two-component system response regulator CreB [uncultured Lamprocystis sp.]|jgi:two-component system catabolic regulation response regulator CreB|uniref:two-component system response regulator CreB n=1 Tax=uncultured Lamprocystis sp. TaxID=543132 RepID=UPI0025DF0E28|nr:two-component system response regulator CreB [uncultured Lamprocystis sp.]